MALRVKKLRFPKELANTSFEIELEQVGISEDGEPISSFRDTGKCIFSEKSKRVIDENGKRLLLSGKIAIEGDIAPELKIIASGNVLINGRKYDIYAGYRPRNPDGSVFMTEFDLM